MLKKMTIILAVLMLLIPISVNAATFEDGDTKYTLEEVVLNHDMLKERAYYMGMDEDTNYVFEVMKEQNVISYYKANKDKCELMTNQEILNFYHYSYTYYGIEMVDYDLYLVEEAAPLYMYYIKPTSYDANKTYYRWNDNIKWYEAVGTSSEAELSEYYILAWATFPTTATIEENITYYTVGNRGELIKVENPVSDNILDYMVITDESKIVTRTKVKTLDSNKFASILAGGDVFLCSYNKSTKEMFLAQYNFDDGEYYVYDLDGNRLENIEYIEAYSDSIYGAVYNDGTYKILNKDMESIYENKELELYEESYNDYINYLVGYDKTYSKDVFYNLYTYKLLSKENQAYANKDLKIEFSGQKDRIKAITVNGKKLSESNYSISGSLTTITLKKSYLNTLTKGEYVLEVEYIDGVKLTSTFVKNTNPALDNTPATGGMDMSIMTLASIASVALIGVAGTVVYSKKED